MAEKIAGIQPLQECLLKTLGENLIGIYLHGSLAFGCFHPLKSDIDVLAVVERPLTQPEKEKVIHSLLSIWHFAPEKGYEMSIVLEKVCRRFAYPTPYELHFSKAWIERFREDPKSVCNDFPKTDPDLAAHFAVVKARGITLFGPPAPELFAEIPEEAYRFTEQHHIEFGRRWLLRRLEICPNAYYNYLKRRKADCYTHKSEVQNQIKEDLPLAQGSRWLPQHES